MTEEFLSEWFISGLEEIGITADEYRKAEVSERNKIRQCLAQMGHY